MAETLERNPHAAVRPEWLALRTEAILEPELKIVDPHHHLWDRQDNPYLFHDLLADMTAGHNVVSTVFVQCRTIVLVRMELLLRRAPPCFSVVSRRAYSVPPWDLASPRSAHRRVLVVSS